MDGDNGFMLLDALAAAGIISLAAAYGFGILCASIRQSAAAADTVAALGAAEEVIALEQQAGRCLGNPLGEPLSPGERESSLSLSGRVYHLRFRKEVVESCPGLHRWTVILSAPSPGEGLPGAQVRLLAGSYDPFREEASP